MYGALRAPAPPGSAPARLQLDFTKLKPTTPNIKLKPVTRPATSTCKNQQTVTQWLVSRAELESQGDKKLSNRNGQQPLHNLEVAQYDGLIDGDHLDSSDDCLDHLPGSTTLQSSPVASATSKILLAEDDEFVEIEALLPVTSPQEQDKGMSLVTSCSNEASTAVPISPALAKHRKYHPRLVKLKRLGSRQPSQMERSAEAHGGLVQEAKPVIMGMRQGSTHSGRRGPGSIEGISRPAILRRAAASAEIDAVKGVKSIPLTFSATSDGTKSQGAGKEAGLEEAGLEEFHDSVADLVADVSQCLSGRDRKWCMRMPPISSVVPSVCPKPPASRQKSREKNNDTSRCLNSSSSSAALESARGTAQTLNLQDKGSGSVGEYFNFENWGIDDKYLSSLCRTYRQSLKGVKHVILAHNRITVKGLKAFLEKLDSPDLQSLNVAETPIGSEGCLAISRSIGSWKWPLRELNLSGNELGDRAVERLCLSLKLCKQLSGLGLSKNGLGQSEFVGRALADLISASSSLSMIDLHWNHFCGSCGLLLLTGIYDSAESPEGNITRLNLSWNSLGKKIKKRPDDCYGDLSAKMLASIFQSSKTLFHLDISYNRFRAAECKILADGLRTNHTLFGIHVGGNDCSLDDLGFIQPQPANGDEIIVAGEQQERINRYVENIPRKCGLEFVCRELSTKNQQDEGGAPQEEPAGEKRLFKDPSTASLASFHSRHNWDLEPEKDWVKERSKVQRPETFGAEIIDSFRKDARCCWICENWSEYEVQYIPGLSDIDHEEQDIKSAFAFFSVDNFTRPIRLTRLEETYSRRHFKPATAASQGRQPKLTASGKLVRFVGQRMLPPSMVSMHVIFQINDQIRTSDDMLTTKFNVSKKVSLQTSEQFPIPEDTAPVEFQKVNRVQVAVKVMDKFLKGEGNPLVVLEDQDKRGKCSVVPRKLPDAYEHKTHKVWRFEDSSWYGYRFDTDAMYEECFDFDWNCSKLEKFIQGSKSSIASKNLQEMFKTVARPQYAKILAGFRSILSKGDFTGKYPFGAGMMDYTYFLQELAPDFFDKDFSVTRDSDSIFIAANLVTDKEKKATVFLNAPEKGLARCQFLEALVRVAHKKYFQTEKCMTIAASFKELISVLEPSVKKYRDLKESFHAQLFNAENDMIFKDYKERIRTIFDYYKMKLRNPGLGVMNLSYTSWLKFCDDSGMGEHLSRQNFGAAFVLAKQTTVNELQNWRHMELNYIEFLVALGALMKLRSDFEPDFFADLLDEFFEENMQEVLILIEQEEAAARGGRPRDSTQVSDPALIPILALIRKIFEEADQDRSGTIDLREFKMALAAPEILEEMKNLGLKVEDINLLFRRIDADASGGATLDEMCSGFVRMKLEMAGMERTLAYIQRAFNQADKDSSGLLSRTEFIEFFTSPTVQRKLHSLGVDASDCEDLFLTLDYDLDGMLSLDELLNGCLKLRDGSKAGNKAMNYVKTLFLEADKDGSGDLSRQEFKKAFTDERCITKLRRLKLTLPAWDCLFDQLDTDGDGAVSWEELSEGMQIFWSNSQMAEADAMKMKKSRSSVTVEEPSKGPSEDEKMLSTSSAMHRASTTMVEYMK